MFNNLTVKSRLFLLIGFFMVMMIITSVIGLKGMRDSNSDLHSVYNDRTIPLSRLAEITDTMAMNVNLLFNASMLQANSSEGLSDEKLLSGQINNIERNIAYISKLWKEYTDTNISAEEKKIADEYASLRSVFVKDGLLATISLLKQGRSTEALNLMSQSVIPKYGEAVSKAVELKNYQIKFAKQAYEKSESGFGFTSFLAVLCFFLASGFGLLMGFLIIRKLTRDLGGEPSYAVEAVNRVSKGDFTMNLKVNPDDTTSLVARLKVMQKSINEFVASQDTMVQQHTNGMISETMWAEAFPGTFGKMAEQINHLVGAHITVKMRVIEVVNEYAKGNFNIDMDRLPGEKAKVTDAVDNVKKTLLGLSNELKMLCDAGAEGDFSKRGDANKYEHNYRDILTNFNHMIETCDTGFNDVLRVSQALAKGDLTQAITREYPGALGEMKAGINSTVENLKEMVSSIQDASTSINTASKEIAAGNNDLSHRTEEQAASLEQTAASMNELTSTVHANTENAKQANQLAIGAAEVASKGVDVVGQVVTTMDSINESSRKITEIITVIDGIAFQTNILALNAAVEAARAGEQGRGFAVVAGEVRNLAQRAAAAAGEIKGLIGDSEVKVAAGSKLVANAGKTMEEIVNAIQNVTTIVSEISSASIEQNSGINQVNMAIAQMDDVTQQNAALVEQAAASAEAMQEQTENLAMLAGHFKVDNNRISSTHAPVKLETYKSSSQVRSAPVVTKPQMSVADNSEWEEF